MTVQFIFLQFDNCLEYHALIYKNLLLFLILFDKINIIIVSVDYGEHVLVLLFQRKAFQLSISWVK